MLSRNFPHDDSDRNLRASFMLSTNGAKPTAQMKIYCVKAVCWVFAMRGASRIHGNANVCANSNSRQRAEPRA